MELLESSGVRPRQARYQAALRPDVMSPLIIHFATQRQSPRCVVAIIRSTWPAPLSLDPQNLYSLFRLYSFS
jgi:hypothetical protein